jgi:hypothetical protein
MRNLLAACLLLACLALSAAAAPAPPDPDPLAGAPTELADSLALAALTQSAAVAAALQRPQQAPRWLGAGTCSIWQQPGVALVITDAWRLDAPPPEVWLSQARLAAFLATLPHLKRERPPLRISEAELVRYGGTDELYLEPAVYLLDASAAADRLAEHAGSLAAWAAANPDSALLQPPPDSLAPACAVVYLDGSGPLEFYFTQQADGSLSLTHFVFYEFFSA